MARISGVSASDLTAIESAVREAEGKSSGQIVPYIVGRSDDYRETVWKGAALGALAGVALSAFWMRRAWDPSPWVATLVPASAALVGFLAAHVPAVRRWLAGREEMAHRVRHRAESAFVEREVFSTRHRTGVLILVSMFERRVAVLADTAIHRKVGEASWEGITREIARGIREGKAGAAIADAVRQCGALLAQHGFAAEPGRREELSDRPVVEKE